MDNPFLTIEKRLCNIEKILLDLGQPPKPERLNDEEAAMFLGCKVSYLAQLRHKRAIPYLKAGKFCTYLRKDLEAYLQRQPSRNEMKQNAMTWQHG